MNLIRRNLNCLREVWRCPILPAHKSCKQLLLVLGYQIRQEKLLPFILEQKQKQEHRRTLGESGRKVNT